MYKIIPADKKDISLLRELCFKVWPQTYSGILTDDQISYMLDLMYSEASLQKQMDDGARFLLLYDDENARGYASYQDMGDETYKLHKIYVLPSEQGKGAGKLMINHILSTVKNMGGKKLELQVNKGNKARYFYEKLGFKIDRELKLDIGNGYFMDDYIMTLHLRTP